MEVELFPPAEAAAEAAECGGAGGGAGGSRQEAAQEAASEEKEILIFRLMMGCPLDRLFLHSQRGYDGLRTHKLTITPPRLLLPYAACVA